MGLENGAQIAGIRSNGRIAVEVAALVVGDVGTVVHVYKGGAAYEVSGDLTIAFEAERIGEKVTATRIRRMQGTLD